MRARVAAFAAALTACATSDAVLAPPPSRPASGPTPVAAPTFSARFFQAIPDEVYWVSHDAATDVVVSRGARFVLDSGGLDVLGESRGDEGAARSTQQERTLHK